jgi:hypothetical protein
MKLDRRRLQAAAARGASQAMAKELETQLRKQGMFVSCDPWPVLGFEVEFPSPFFVTVDGVREYVKL